MPSTDVIAVRFYDPITLWGKGRRFSVKCGFSKPIRGGAVGRCTAGQEVAGSIPDGGHWNFSLTSSFRPHNGPGVDLATKRNEYQ
jgi:hypothetical protein